MKPIQLDLAPVGLTHGPACAHCSGPTRLTGIEPHATLSRTDLQTFQCLVCETVQTQVVPLPQ
jgi:hypothetical protein